MYIYIFFNKHHNLSSFEGAESYVLEISIYSTSNKQKVIFLTVLWNKRENIYLSVAFKYHIQSHIFNICNFKTIPELQTIHLEKRLCLTRLYMCRNCNFDVVFSPSQQNCKYKQQDTLFSRIGRESIWILYLMSIIKNDNVII